MIILPATVEAISLLSMQVKLPTDGFPFDFTEIYSSYKPDVYVESSLSFNWLEAVDRELSE